MNSGRLPWARGREPSTAAPLWGRLAGQVMRRPALLAIPVLAALMLLALPLRHVQLGTPDDRVLPATTQSNGLVDGLRVANARRIAVATAYTDTVTERLKIFLEEYGFQVTFAKGLGYERIPEGAATQEILFKLGAAVYANSNKADALVMSCGALRTLDLIVPLENQIKVPMVSSTPHGLMNGVRLLGISPRSKGYGMVLAKA